MSNIADRVKNAIQTAGLTYEEIAQKTTISKSAIQRYATGETKKIPLDRIEEIARITNVPTAYLLGWEDETSDINLFKFNNISPIQTKKIPLLGDIACGAPVFAEEDFTTFVEAASSINADFCLRAKGDSMIGARIYDGDIVFIHKQPTVENGQIAAVIINDEATLKRVSYFPEKNMLILKPENPAYEDFVYVGEELNNINILGKAVAFQSLVK